MTKWLSIVLALAIFRAGGGAGPSVNATVLAQPYAQFGFELLRNLQSSQPKSNVFLSPTSIALALAMTANGADGTTRAAILKTLHSDTQPVDQFNAANQALVEQITNTAAVQLSTANAIWVQKGFPVNPPFTQILNENYRARAENVDFHDPQTARLINSWVEQHTNGRIRNIIGKLSPSAVMVLSNAIAFKGKWATPFDPKETQPHSFQTVDGPERNIQMMKHSAQYAYANMDGLETIRLPYTDGSFAMYIVLPQNSDRMSQFLQQLTAEKFMSMTASLRRQRGTIELPRFTLKYDTSLNASLGKLGMAIAFTRQANFDALHKAPPHLEISEVRHASFLQVDEEGTEAAAATTSTIHATVARVEPPPFHMVVDHPFFVMIRDERNQQLLFAGIIVSPES